MEKFKTVYTSIAGRRIIATHLFLLMFSFVFAAVNQSYAENTYVNNESIIIQSGDDLTLGKMSYGVYPEELHFTSILTKTKGKLTIKVFSLCCNNQNALILNGSFLYPDGVNERIEMFSDIKAAPEIVNFSKNVPEGTKISFTSGLLKSICDEFPCEYFVKVLFTALDNDDDDSDDNSHDGEGCSGPGFPAGHPFDGNCSQCHDDGHSGCNITNNDGSNGDDKGCSGPGFPAGHPFDGNCSQCHDDGRTDCSTKNNEGSGGDDQGCSGPGFPEGHPFDGNCSQCHNDGRTGCDEPEAGKSFTFKCERNIEFTNIRDLEKLVMSVSESLSCVLKLTKFKENARIGIKYSPLGRKSTQISPIQGNTGTSGELTFTIDAVRKGRDWISWAIAENEDKFDFSLQAHNNGSAWGMFVEVK